MSMTRRAVRAGSRLSKRCSRPRRLTTRWTISSRIPTWCMVQPSAGITPEKSPLVMGLLETQPVNQDGIAGPGGLGIEECGAGRTIEMPEHHPRCAGDESCNADFAERRLLADRRFLPDAGVRS